MKITKTQLKQIIKEELSTLSEHGDWFDEENLTEDTLKEHAYASNLSEIIELGLRAKGIKWEGALPMEIFEVIRDNKEALAPLDTAINHLIYQVAG
jgi:hypothetical protein